MEVPIDQVLSDAQQPRRDWRHAEGERRLEELTASIREFGVLQPLLVHEEGTVADGRQLYIIISGARRRAAAERAGLWSLPVVVKESEPAQVRILQLIENLQRQELSPLDEARAYQELMDLQSLTPPAVAARVHVSGQQVRDRLRLLADQVFADAVERRQIAASTAREIAKLPDEEVHAFRQRVLAGEHLLLSEVQATRERLAALGRINPRRKVRRLGDTPPSAPGNGEADPPPHLAAGDQDASERAESKGATGPLNSLPAGIASAAVEQDDAAHAPGVPGSPPEMGDHAAGDAKRDVPRYVPGAVSLDEVSPPITQSIPDDGLRRDAGRLAQVITSGLDAGTRAVLASALGSHRGQPDQELWWRSVFEELCRRL